MYRAKDSLFLWITLFMVWGLELLQPFCTTTESLEPEGALPFPRMNSNHKTQEREAERSWVLGQQPNQSRITSGLLATWVTLGNTFYHIRSLYISFLLLKAKIKKKKKNYEAWACRCIFVCLMQYCLKFWIIVWDLSIRRLHTHV